MNRQRRTACADSGRLAVSGYPTARPLEGLGAALPLQAWSELLARGTMRRHQAGSVLLSECLINDPMCPWSRGGAGLVPWRVC